MSAPVGAVAPRDRRVTINCGGTLSQISLSLLQAHPLTLLARLTAALPAVAPAYAAAAGELFLDRDPASFAVVLNWYRYGKLAPPTSLPPDLLADDIVYFGLPVLSDAARQPSAAAMGSDGAMAGSSPPFVPGLSKFNSYAVSPRAGGVSGAMPAVSRANSQFGSEESVPTLLSQPSFAPQLSHMASLHAPAPAANYMSVDESNSTVVPVVNILPPTPPVLSTANSMAPTGPAQLQQQRSIVAAPMLIHQLSGGGANLMGSLQRTLSPIAATNYLSLGAEDVNVAAVPIAPTTQRAASAIVAPQQPQQPQQPSQPSSGAVTPITQPALAKALSQPMISGDMAPAAGAASAAAVPSTTTAAPSSAASGSTAATSAAVPSPSASAAISVVAAPAAAVAPAHSPPAAAAAAPRPRVPFDLAIEMLSCFKDVNRVQALALLDAPTVAKHAAGDYFSADVAAAAAAPSAGGGGGGDEGSYLFRYCNDPDERLSDGSVNRDLFVLSYLHQRKMYNTKIFRHFLGPNNSIGASTLHGYVLSDEKHPLRKDQTHTSLITLTHAIIGTHAKALALE